MRWHHSYTIIIPQFKSIARTLVMLFLSDDEDGDGKNKAFLFSELEKGKTTATE